MTHVYQSIEPVAGVGTQAIRCGPHPALSLPAGVLRCANPPRARRVWHNPTVRISASVDYAIRAMTELAVVDRPMTAEQLAIAQDLPLRYLLGILGDLRRARLVLSHRGPEGGFTLARPAQEIWLAEIFRAIDGPLAEVHDLSVTTLRYRGPAADLRRVWMAVRASLRRVLETVSLADVASGQLPELVQLLADEYEASSPESKPDALGGEPAVRGHAAKAHTAKRKIKSVRS